MNTVVDFEFMPFSVTVIEDPDEVGVEVVIAPPMRHTPWLLLWSHFDPRTRNLKGAFGRRK